LVTDPHELEAQINQAQARVTEAEKSLEMARVSLKRADIQAEAASRNQLDHRALVQNEVAQYQLQAAQIGVEMAEVALEGAKQQVDHLTRLRDRPLVLITQANATEAAYQQAEAAVLAAEANLIAVQADPTPEDIAVAQAQMLEAEAALDAIQVQLDKLTLTAPRDGLVSQKLVNPGELAAPGAVLLELSDIDTVDLTVFIPETRIGQVKIGQKALVYVDAYEDEVFEGTVSFIAHEAEFTPRNVQTQEERVNLVFAVKITLDNADHRLKPGMPADAEIVRD
jgi:HlyD family secretion protein